MYETERIITSVSIALAIIALLIQFTRARGGGRKEYSVKAGSTLGGILYNFTSAMTPAHKETIRLHPAGFIIGVLMHIGIILTIVRVFILIIFPAIYFSHIILGLLTGIATICAFFFLVKRAVSVELHSMSSPEDYLSILITTGFLLAATLHEFNVITPGVFLVCAAVLFLYIPLGKLRHALFFFVARTEFGGRLGYRGTYPVRSGARK